MPDIFIFILIGVSVAIGIQIFFNAYGEKEKTYQKLCGLFLGALIPAILIIWMVLSCSNRQFSTEKCKITNIKSTNNDVIKQVIVLGNGEVVDVSKHITGSVITEYVNVKEYDRMSCGINHLQSRGSNSNYYKLEIEPIKDKE